MNDDSLDDTFEEGRVALYKLERQLKNQQEPAYCGDNRSEVSKQHSSSSDRRALDQLPRNTRLNQRLESLGLTVEVLYVTYLVVNFMCNIIAKLLGVG